MAPTWTDTQIANHLTRSGLEWSGTTITYGFLETLPSWAQGLSVAAGFSATIASQRQVARQVMELWDDLIAVDVAEATGSTNVEFGNSTTGVSYAFAYFPGGSGVAGSVWFNTTYDADTGTNDLMTPERGAWGYTTYIHEIGHALGLSHPGDYSGSVNYDDDALYAQDSVMYTVMSYFDASNTGADWQASDGEFHEAQTPMVHDILAIQKLYGADMATRAGNTVYGFNSTAGHDTFDFSINRHPVLTIWDGSGIDTLDLSGFTSSSRIDLDPGAYSDCDAMTLNLAIAIGCFIENATGGSAADDISGNSLANILTGNGGNDMLRGRNGNDSLRGGAGADILNGGLGVDTADYSTGLAVSMNFRTGTLAGAAAGDTLVSIERISGSATEGDTLIGNVRKDVFFGKGGNDTLDGGGGDDQLYGDAGNDVIRGSTGADLIRGGLGLDNLTGGDGGDTFRFASAAETGNGSNSDRITDFVKGVDHIDVSGAGPAPLLSFTSRNGNSYCAIDFDRDGVVDGRIVVLGVADVSAGDFIV